jgi:hypothetical protein
VKVLLGGILQAFAGMDVEDYQAAAHVFLHEGRHPTLGRGFRECGYRPMIELLEYLAANGFTSYIASGGDRDFMRPITEALYGIPSERVIGSSNALRYEPDEHGGSIVYLTEPDVFDDGPVKPVRIWSRVGRRPILAAGNSNGDIRCCTSPAGRHGLGCGCWCCTTTPSGSSTTSPGPSGLWSRPPPRDGRWSASSTTGRPCSTTPTADLRMQLAVRCRLALKDCHCQIRSNKLSLLDSL